MRATAHSSVTQPVPPRKHSVRRLNRVPLMIVGVLGIAVVRGGISVAVDRANRRTPEAPKAGDFQGSRAIAQQINTGRPDGVIAPRTAEQPAMATQQALVAQPGTVQPAISRSPPAAQSQSDPMEELRKREIGAQGCDTRPAHRWRLRRLSAK
jgi:hypothetical protein